MLPTAAQLIALLVELEDDPARRHALANGYDMFAAAKAESLVADDQFDGFAAVVSQLIDQDLLRFSSQAAGRPQWPTGVAWNSTRLQEHYDFSTTALGRADAERYRRFQQVRVPETHAEPEPEQSREGSWRRWMSQLRFVFGLPPGSGFRPFAHPLPHLEMQRLQRYVDSTRQLYNSHALAQPDTGYRVSFTTGGPTEVEANLPQAESIRGTAALFRQLYANEEPASFAAVSGLLIRANHEQGDADKEVRHTMLAAWRQAQGRLRGRWLEALLIEQGQRRGTIPTGVSSPDSHLSPEQVLSAFFYGEHLHWDRGRAELERWRSDPLSDAHHTLLFLRGMGQLSALYIAFAALAVTAMPDDRLS